MTDDDEPVNPQDADAARGEEGRVVARQDSDASAHTESGAREQAGARSAPIDAALLGEAGVSHVWPRTDEDATADLLGRLRNAQQHITVFGLTRNFYARDNVLPLFEAKATTIPVTFFAMDPRCEARRDRYRLEPLDAALEDPNRLVREVLRPLHAASERVAPAAEEGAGLQVFLYNFPCSFAIEQIDQACRVMLYGHGKRGTDSPIFVFETGTPYYDFFRSQIEWLRLLANDPPEQWTDKDLAVRPLTPDDLTER